MKRTLSIAVLLSCFVTACAVDDEQPTNDLELSDVESASTVCGYAPTCPEGQHAAYYTCSWQCGYCGPGWNSAVCVANTTTTFDQCGTECGSGYHENSLLCRSGCGYCNPLNGASCSLDSGSAFQQCGKECGSGYHPTQYFCKSGCSAYGCDWLSGDAATCSLNTSYFTQCGTTCPAGYRTVNTTCNNQCGSCTSYFTRNAATCAL